jgi:NADH-quinone oxidoreductase subunit H
MVELIVMPLVKFACIVLGWVMLVATVLTLMERKQSAAMQNRVGPNRAFLFGKRFPLSAFIGQILADALKVLFKEDFDPPQANKWIHRISPAIALIPVLLMWLVIPFGPGPKPGFEGPHYFQIADLNAGVLVILAVASLAVYGATLGAWASNSAYSLLGGLRTAAQMVSYEVTLGLNLVGIFMIYSSLRLNDIIWAQGELLWGVIPKWGIVVQPLAFVLFMVASIAETKRAPFDLPEAESELAAGYFTEFSSMRFALFSLGEFIGIVVVAALGATMFLGGWQVPFVDTPVDETGNPVLGLLTIAQVGIFLFKMILLIWLQMQIRWTLPRFRYDQLMTLGWVILLPLSLANVAVTAIMMYVLR